MLPPALQSYSNWITIVDFTARMTLKFDGWPRKIIEHVSYTASSYVHHFKSISEFKLTVQKHPIWVKLNDFFSRVTLKLYGWPWKTKGHLFYATSSFVHHFVAIGEFKLELQYGNAKFGSNSTIFRAVWPWNLTYDIEKQYGNSSMPLQALCIIS